MNKITIPIFAVTLLITGFVNWGIFKTKVEVAEKDIAKVEEKVEKVEDINMEQTYLMKEQAYILENTVKTLEKLNTKIDQIQ